MRRAARLCHQGGIYCIAAFMYALTGFVLCAVEVDIVFYSTNIKFTDFAVDCFVAVEGEHERAGPEQRRCWRGAGGRQD